MISVIVPVRNAEKTVKRAVESVLTQNYRDIEVICVVNGCTDASEQVLRGIDDHRVVVAHSSPGIVPALNEGLRRSKGNLIARQDADDIWHEGKLSAQVSYMSDHPDIDILGTQLSIVDGEGRHIRDAEYPLDHEGILTSLMNSVNPIGHPSVVFRRSILDKCAGYFDLFPLAEDLDLWTRAAAWHRFANLREKYVTYQHVPNPKYDPRVPKTLTSWYRMIYGVK